MDANRFDLASICNSDLFARVVDISRRQHGLLADELCCFAEIDRRRSFLERGAPSLFSYAVEVLGYSEDAAYKRVHAARAARRFPQIFELVACGELSLTAVNLLSPHLTVSNHGEMLAGARGKTKREIGLLIALMSPQPDVSASVVEWVVASREDPGNPQVDSGIAGSDNTRSNEVIAGSSRFGGVRPLSPGRFRLQVMLSGDGERALAKATALLRHVNPSGAIEVVVERALVELAERLEVRKIGKPLRRRGQAPEQEVTADSAGTAPSGVATSVDSPPPLTPSGVASAPPVGHDATGSADVGGVPEASPRRRKHALAHARGRAAGGSGRSSRSPRRRIPNAVKQAVWERDGGRCTFVSPEGRRCSAVEMLEFHHLDSVARGGETSVDGITLRCRGHNRLEAELDFGVEHVAAAIEAKRSRAKKRVKRSRAATRPARAKPRTRARRRRRSTRR